METTLTDFSRLTGEERNERWRHVHERHFRGGGTTDTWMLVDSGQRIELFNLEPELARVEDLLREAVARAVEGGAYSDPMVPPLLDRETKQRTVVCGQCLLTMVLGLLGEDKVRRRVNSSGYKGYIEEAASILKVDAWVAAQIESGFMGGLPATNEPWVAMGALFGRECRTLFSDEDALFYAREHLFSTKPKRLRHGKLKDCECLKCKNGTGRYHVSRSYGG